MITNGSFEDNSPGEWYGLGADLVVSDQASRSVVLLRWSRATIERNIERNIDVGGPAAGAELLNENEMPISCEPDPWRFRWWHHRAI